MQQLLDEAAAGIEKIEAMDDKEHRRAVLVAQRRVLLEARDDGVHSAEVLEVALRDVDIEELVLDVHSQGLEPRTKR